MIGAFFDRDVAASSGITSPDANLFAERSSRIGIFHRMQTQTLSRCGRSRTTPVALFQQIGNIARGTPASAHLQQRADDFPYHVTQKRRASNNVEPFAR